jgi:hypothetical protein
MTMLQMMWNTPDKPEILQFQTNHWHPVIQSEHPKMQKNNKMEVLMGWGNIL